MTTDPLTLIDGPGQLLPGRVAVITGAASGIGAASAQLFAEHGATVVIVDIDEKAHETAAGIGDAASAIVADVRSSDDVARVRDEVLAAHGQVDVLMNNAGHWVRQVQGFGQETPELVDQLHQINFLHIITMIQAFLPSMQERQSGSIINVASVEGMRGYPAAIAYGAYKAAAIQLTKSLGVQLGNEGIRVNGMGPDVTDSVQVPYDRMVRPEHQDLWPIWVPVGRMGMPRDQARIALFLASDLSAFITGHTIPTDGGTAAAGGWFRSNSHAGRTGWTNRPIAP